MVLLETLLDPWANISSTQKVESVCGGHVGCKASRSSCFRFFFLAIKGPTRVGHPRAEVPHRPGCGVRLTAPAGVFLYVVLRGSFQGTNANSLELTSTKTNSWKLRPWPR